MSSICQGFPSPGGSETKVPNGKAMEVCPRKDLWADLLVSTSKTRVFTSYINLSCASKPTLNRGRKGFGVLGFGLWCLPASSLFGQGVVSTWGREEERRRRIAECLKRHALSLFLSFLSLWTFFLSRVVYTNYRGVTGLLPLNIACWMQVTDPSKAQLATRPTALDFTKRSFDLLFSSFSSQGLD
jgi:hypothetical protein